MRIKGRREKGGRSSYEKSAMFVDDGNVTMSGYLYAIQRS